MYLSSRHHSMSLQYHQKIFYRADKSESYYNLGRPFGIHLEKLIVAELPKKVPYSMEPTSLLQEPTTGSYSQRDVFSPQPATLLI
jgi:hypothetical protein